MTRRLTKQQSREYRAYLANCTDAQVQGCYDKERHYGNRAELRMIEYEAARRGLALDRDSHHSYRMED